MASSLYSGPKRIVILGGGLAGVAAFDALTTSLAACSDLPSDVRLTLIEAEDEVGGRAQSWPVDGPSARHPHAPYGTNGPHGIHFVWGSYAHLQRLMGDLTGRLSGGTATYCAWMAPPDLVGTAPRVAAVHVCDPSRPDTAWNPRARRILRAFQDATPVVRAFESLLQSVLGVTLSAHELLSYMDLVFDEENLGPELRWSLLLSRAVIAQIGSPETNHLLRTLLGKSPADADMGELVKPLFFQHVAPRMKRAHNAMMPLHLASLGTWPRKKSSKPPADPQSAARFPDDLRAIADFVELLARDAAKLSTSVLTYDPRASGFLKNALKAAFSNPYPLDVGTVLRDAQFGLRSYEGAILRLFDGDDSRGMWRAIAERAAQRLPGVATIQRGRIAAKLATVEGHVTRVGLTKTRASREPDVPALRVRAADAVTDWIDADVVISTLLPRSLTAILESNAPADLTQSLETLGGRMNETLNLQLFFPRKIAMPVVDPPPGSGEVPALSISNLEGPFTIVVDLRRGWSKEKFEAIRLDENAGRPFDGTAWELVGTYPECFTFDPFANAGRVQWPKAVQEKLAAITNDPDDFDKTALDERKWVHDTGTPGHMAQPILGEVLASRAAAYQKKWTEKASPIVVGQTMRLLADLPGLSKNDAEYLRTQASAIEAGAANETRYTLLRACHAENRFFSAEPGLFEVRPHARFPTAIGGLWVAGDWTRNGLNLQAMEAATISGLQAACGVLEHVRAGGIAITKLPQIDPSILPEGAWDSGHEV